LNVYNGVYYYLLNVTNNKLNAIKTSDIDSKHVQYTSLILNCLWNWIYLYMTAWIGKVIVKAVRVGTLQRITNNDKKKLNNNIII